MPQPRLHESSAQRQAAYRQRVHQARQEQLTAHAWPPLPAWPTVPGQARWLALRVQAQWCLTHVTDEMQQYYEDRSEAWQESEKPVAFEARLAAVEAALQALDGTARIICKNRLKPLTVTLSCLVVPLSNRNCTS